MNAIEAGTLTGAALQTYLADVTLGAGRVADFNMLINARGHARRMASSATAMSAVANSATAMSAVANSATAMTAVANSATAMSAVIASATAMSAVANSATAMTAINANDQAVRILMLAGTNQVYSNFANVSAVAASSTAMTAVWASNAAADAVLTSTTARLAVYNNDTALAALQANPTQVSRQIGIGAGRVTTASTATTSFTYVTNGTKVILLRMWETGGQDDPSLCFARGYTGAANSTTAGIILPLTGENLGKATIALGHTTTYANSGVYPSASNDNANVVSAANGLARNTWSLVGNTTQNVIYITV